MLYLAAENSGGQDAGSVIRTREVTNNNNTKKKNLQKCQGGGRVVRKLRFITEEKVERVGGDAVCGTVGVASSELNRFSLF